MSFGAIRAAHSVFADRQQQQQQEQQQQQTNKQKISRF